jgi:hypothetical protein
MSDIEQIIKTANITFATPCYGGNITESCFISYMKFSNLASQLGLRFSLDTVMNESIITRARNNLVAKFLTKPDSTHLMFIDADIGWEPESILKLLATNADVVCGAYPIKGLPITYALNRFPNGRIIDSMLEVSTAATGFMMIKRHVIEKLVQLFPEKKYNDACNLGADVEKNMYALFDTMIDEKGNYLTEDWTFCKHVIEKLNIPIWINTDITLNHTGTFVFKGSQEELKKFIIND